MNTGRLLAPLDRFLSYLSISGETDVLEGMLIAASDTFQQECSRDLTLSQHSEIRTGDTSNSLQLSNYPVQSESELKIWVSDDREYTDENLLSSDDYILEKEKGSIILIEDVFESELANIKAEYYAGYSRFVIVANNNSITIDEGGGEYTIEIDTGIYNALELAENLQQKLNDNGDLSNTYTVEYSLDLQKFTISADGDFSIISNGSTALDLLGYKNEDKVLASGHIADHYRPGMPRDIENAVIMLAQKFYQDSLIGDGRQGLRSVDDGEGYSRTYMVDPFPPFVDKKINAYRKYE